MAFHVETARPKPRARRTPSLSPAALAGTAQSPRTALSSNVEPRSAAKRSAEAVAPLAVFAREGRRGSRRDEVDGAERRKLRSEALEQGVQARERRELRRAASGKPDGRSAPLFSTDEPPAQMRERDVHEAHRRKGER